RGHAQESDNGLVTFPFTIRNQVLTSFSTLEAAVALRAELLAMQRDFPKETAAATAASKVKAYVFGDDGDPARAWAFLDLLAKHRIEVRALANEFSVNGRTYSPGKAWVVLTQQSQYRLLTEIFTKRTQFEDTIFYDVSGWTIPLAYNLPYAELEQAPATGAVVGRPAFPAGALVGGHSIYAYAFNWNGYFAPRALQRLHRAGITVRGLTSAIEALAADGSRVAFAPGAILVPVGMQTDKAALIRSVIDTIVKEDAVTVHGLGTGLTPKGVDLGSSSFVPLAPARVALVVGDSVDPHDIGAAWHVLDQRVGLTPTLLEIDQLGRANLGRYNVVVMADGRYDDLPADAAASLKTFVRGGGTLLVMGRAAQWAGKNELAALEFTGGGAPGIGAGRNAPPSTPVEGAESGKR
ncbi:MAG: zinc carboxypeptidase, partial [Opitutus sp.]|nr:zinc carboxypeptidase [Opitutus sp.]